MAKKGTFGLKDAYAITSPDAARAFYDAWAKGYDVDLLGGHGYIYPAEIAAMLDKSDAAGPVLDVGCGTGLLGAALSARPVDGVDISPGMLAEAAKRGCYRRLIEADVTRPLPMEAGHYSGVVSAGTFTEGHVGPDALETLLPVAAVGALFLLGISARVYQRMGFDAAFAALAAAGRISEPRLRQARVYDAGAAHENADALFMAVSFQKT